MSRYLFFFTRKKPIACRYFYSLVIVGALLCGQAALAANDANVEMTLADAIALSLSRHPQLKAQEFRHLAADERTNQARVRTDREIQLQVDDVLGSSAYKGADSAQTTLSISWALEGRYVDKRVEAAEATQSLLAIERDRQRFDVAARTAQAFLTALAYQERLVLAQYAHDNAQRALKDIHRRGRAGSSSAVDVLRAEVELQRRKLDVEDLEHELSVARQQLSAQWGETNQNDFTLAGQLSVNQTLVSFADLKTRLKGSPRVRTFLTRARVNDSEIAMAKAASKARWRFSAGLRRYEASDDYGVVAGVAVPLGNRTRNRARMNELAAEQSFNQALAISEENSLQVRLFGLYQELLHSRHQAKALSEKMIPRLQRAVDAANDAYAVGRFSYLEWLSVKQELLDARLDLVNAQLTSHVNLTEIERLTGVSLSAVSTEQK
jgi:cobalt-zinc-cadmium efflux system outer membrane protein